jgi:hypothetical protein
VVWGGVVWSGLVWSSLVWYGLGNRIKTLNSDVIFINTKQPTLLTRFAFCVGFVFTGRFDCGLRWSLVWGGLVWDSLVWSGVVSGLGIE